MQPSLSLVAAAGTIKKQHQRISSVTAHCWTMQKRKQKHETYGASGSVRMQHRSVKGCVFRSVPASPFKRSTSWYCCSSSNCTVTAATKYGNLPQAWLRSTSAVVCLCGGYVRTACVLMLIATFIVLGYATESALNERKGLDVVTVKQPDTSHEVRHQRADNAGHGIPPRSVRKVPPSFVQVMTGSSRRSSANPAIPVTSALGGVGVLAGGGYLAYVYCRRRDVDDHEETQRCRSDDTGVVISTVSETPTSHTSFDSDQIDELLDAGADSDLLDELSRQITVARGSTVK